MRTPGGSVEPLGPVGTPMSKELGKSAVAPALAIMKRIQPAPFARDSVTGVGEVGRTPRASHNEAHPAGAFCLGFALCFAAHIYVDCLRVRRRSDEDSAGLLDGTHVGIGVKKLGLLKLDASGNGLAAHIALDEEAGFGVSACNCEGPIDRKSTRLNSSHLGISYA